MFGESTLRSVSSAFLGLLALLGVLAACSYLDEVDAASEEGIKPYAENSFYWSYGGQPVVLLGGSEDDNLFQIPNLESHLDEIVAAGGNYIRNTMSDRADAGYEVQAFATSDGRCDLGSWNDAYWNRFETMLRLTAERDIIVQLELWDAWDHNMSHWDNSCWNPDNNVTYEAGETSLQGDGAYRSVNHIGGKHDLFFTVPALANDQKVLAYQEKFVQKVMAYALEYDHVLYTVSNELFNQFSNEWSKYWIDFVDAQASSAGKEVYVAEMFQNQNLRDGRHTFCLEAEPCDFFDASQNSRRSGQDNWDNLQYVRGRLEANPKPINHNKIYGADTASSSFGGSDNATKAWLRSVIGGAASTRFHRPTSGIGLNSSAKAAISAGRKLADTVPLWTMEPRQDLLSDRSDDEAYLCLPTLGRPTASTLRTAARSA